MARDMYEFDMYGVSYRTALFAAVGGFGITLRDSATIRLQELLRLTEVMTSDGAWVSLSKPRMIVTGCGISPYMAGSACSTVWTRFILRSYWR